jgi:subtilisin family serine protease
MAAPPNGKGPQWAEGRVLVQPKPGLSDAAFDGILKGHNARSQGKIRGIGVHLVQVPPQAEEAVARALAKNPHVEFAELDRVVTPDATAVSDPSYGSQWYLPKIGAPGAWDISNGDRVVIAILDTGIDGNHPDLVPNLVPGWNVYNNNADTSDVHGHGTWVAGVAAAAGNNGIGIASVAWGAWLMPVRIADPNAYAYWSTVASGITWAADHGAHVANVSYNGVSGSSTVQSAARYLRSKGGLTVVAAGNSGGEEAIAANGDLITVSATTSTDTKASFSSYGAYVDLAAPGTSMLTTGRGGTYVTVQGTSFASPCVAGVVALMMSANPTLGPAQWENLLLSTTVDLGTAGWDPIFGHGRVDAASAVAAALDSRVQDTQAPTVAVTSPTGGTVQGLVTVNVTASDNVGVARVELWVNGTLYATDASAPFAFTWNSALVPDGTATLVAQAYDAAGNKGTSKAVSVKVDNVPDPIDTTAPIARVLSPGEGSVVSGTVTIQVAASDNVGVTLLEVLVDGAVLCGGNVSPLSCSWNTRKVAAGGHTLTARARDAAGNIGTASVQVQLGTSSTTDGTKPPPGLAKK